MSHPEYLHRVLQMFGPENVVRTNTRKDLWYVDSSDSRFFAT